MRIAGLVVVAIVAALHLYIAWFEIFAWEARGPRIFENFPADLFSQTVDMAANQGLYNAFLAVGLLWSLTIGDRVWQRKIATCFLLFVAVAGIFGAATVVPRIFYIQTIPAVLGIVFLYLDGRRIA